MKQKREISDYVNDILDATTKITEFTKNMDYSVFIKDEKTVFAVIRALEIIGEAAKNIPGSMRIKYPNVPWKEITGIRNKLIHEYFGVDHEVIWRTIKEDIPPLNSEISRILKEIPENIR